jgi:hypothetical protein
MLGSFWGDNPRGFCGDSAKTVTLTLSGDSDGSNFKVISPYSFSSSVDTSRGTIHADGTFTASDHGASGFIVFNNTFVGQTNGTHILATQTTTDNTSTSCVYSFDGTR